MTAEIAVVVHTDLIIYIQPFQRRKCNGHVADNAVYIILIAVDVSSEYGVIVAIRFHGTIGLDEVHYIMAWRPVREAFVVAVGIYTITTGVDEINRRVHFQQVAEFELATQACRNILII